MLDNQGQLGDFANQQIMEGAPVYDVNGDRVGEVSDRGLQRNALIVHKGLIFPKDLYIPLSAIRGRDADGVYLNVAKDDINSHNWDQPPTGAAGTAGVMPDRMATGATNVDRSTNDVNIPLHEEQLVADKQRQQIGDVHLHRDTVQEQQTVQAPVTHEEVTVERRPGDDRALANDAFTDKDIDIPVMGEQLNVSKEAHVAEEVHLRKDRVTEQQQATDTVRRERLRVDGQSDDMFDEADDTSYGATDAADYNVADTTETRKNDNLLP